MRGRAVTYRVLVVDDNEAIHRDVARTLGPRASSVALDRAEAALFGPRPARRALPELELVHAMSGEEAAVQVRGATEAGRPFAVAFVDVRMPPGRDGVQTT